MSRQVQVQKHSPRLSTVKMVEDTMKEMDSIFTVADLKKKLPKQVNHNTLMVILEYLEESNRIYVSVKGMTWLVNNNPNLRELIRTGRRL